MIYQGEDGRGDISAATAWSPNQTSRFRPQSGHPYGVRRFVGLGRATLGVSPPSLSAVG